MSELTEEMFQNAFIAVSKTPSPEFMVVSPWEYQRIRGGYDDKRLKFVNMVHRIAVEIERDWERQYGPQYQTSWDNEYAKKLRAFKKEAEWVSSLEG